MKKITLLISALFVICSGMLAQQNMKRCRTSEAEKLIRDKDPVAFDIMKVKKEQALQDWIINDNAANNKKAVIFIPVVVQIWANTSTVSDTRVAEQIQRLNDDFRRSNSDANNTPSVFSGVDTGIRFCLASSDPDGNFTTGIVRKSVGGSPAQQGGSDLWNTNKYLNIFVYDIGGSVLGFTFTSSVSPNNAVHIDKDNFGNTGGSFNPYNLGRTATHEVGHWFNLEHIWGGGNGCGNDFCGDTPKQRGDNFGCPTFPSTSSCSGNSNGPNGDMFMNYMDYVNDNCMNAFTADQKTRMLASINNDRSGLLSSNGCGPVSVEENDDHTLVSVYPNPSLGIIKIELIEKISSSISVLNMLGEEVYSLIKSTQFFSIDMNNQPNGVYFVKIKSGDNFVTKKILLSK